MAVRTSAAVPATMFTIVLRPRIPLGSIMLQCCFTATKGWRKWTSEEDSQLRKLVTERKSNFGIYSFFPDRTWSSIRSRGKRLRREMGVAGPNFWTDEEIAIVKQTKASGTPLRETFGSLPRRSLNAKWKIPVDRERRDPRFRSGENFTAEDHHSVCRLREELRIKWEEIAGALQRNAYSIKSFYYHRQKATTNVRETNAQNSWTNTDTNTLRDLVAQGRSEMQLAEQMKRSQPMIHRMKAELYHREPGLSQGSLWTAKEDQTARGSFQIRFAGLADSGLDITAKD